MKFETMSSQRTAVAGAMFVMTVALPALMAQQGSVDQESPNRFHLNGRSLFNVSADFRHSRSAAETIPGVGVHGVNHTYANGYVNVDDSENAGNMTWNWGFQANGDGSSPVQGTSLNLRSGVRSPAEGRSHEESADPLPGFELGYGRVLKTFDLHGRPLRLGIQGAFGMTFLDIRDRSTISGPTAGVIDTYDLGGLPIIPNAPYAGSSPVPGGPLPLLLPDSPAARAYQTATSKERMEVDGNLFGFKVGPFLELPLGKSVSVQMQGGFAAVLADGKFSWRESINGGAASSGSDSRSAWLCGGFAEAELLLRISEHFDVSVGGGWQGLEDYSLSDEKRDAKVKLGGGIAAFAGIRYSF